MLIFSPLNMASTAAGTLLSHRQAPAGAQGVFSLKMFFE